MGKKKKTKKKIRSTTVSGNVYIKSTFNNTIITVTDDKGGTVAWGSGGTVGFKGSKKGTAYAAQLIAESVGKQVLEAGMKRANVYVKGPGAGRESSVRGLAGTGLKLELIKDRTPVPHNGCRPKKKRRV